MKANYNGVAQILRVQQFQIAMILPKYNVQLHCRSQMFNCGAELRIYQLCCQRRCQAPPLSMYLPKVKDCRSTGLDDAEKVKWSRGARAEFDMMLPKPMLKFIF